MSGSNRWRPTPAQATCGPAGQASSPPIVSTAVPSAHLTQLLDLARTALRCVELAVDLARLFGDGVADVAQHILALVRGGVLRTAEPAGRRDRADVGQHRLVGAGAAQLVHLVAER